jgi:hypothetical protein
MQDDEFPAGFSLKFFREAEFAFFYVFKFLTIRELGCLDAAVVNRELRPWLLSVISRPELCICQLKPWSNFFEERESHYNYRPNRPQKMDFFLQWISLRRVRFREINFCFFPQETGAIPFCESLHSDVVGFVESIVFADGHCIRGDFIDHVFSMAAWFPNVKSFSLDIFTDQNSNMLLTRIFSDYPHLEGLSINISNNRLPEGLYQIPSSLPKLRRFRYQMSHFKYDYDLNPLLQAFAEKGQELRTLILDASPVAFLGGKWVAARGLYFLIERQQVQMERGQGFLGTIPLFDDDERDGSLFKSIITGCPHLEKLEVTFRQNYDIRLGYFDVNSFLVECCPLKPDIDISMTTPFDDL